LIALVASKTAGAFDDVMCLISCADGKPQDFCLV